MRFVVVGCSYQTTPIELRERLAFAQAELPSALQALTAGGRLAEAMLVSTCNRVEIYGVGEQVESVADRCCELLTRRQVSREELLPVVYQHADSQALSHIFRVAASLDAMVVGETQVMGQVKDAFSTARDVGTIGPLLGRCLERAFFVAKRVRTETEIARHPASISSVAVDLAGRIFEDLSQVAVLIVGAGEMAELAGRHLLGHGTRRLRVANRSLENGQALATELGGEAVPFDTLGEQLLWADVVISSTGSPQPIMSREMLAGVMRKRKQRTLLIVDIAVPRDVEQKARELDNLFLFDVDALQQVLGQNLEARRKEAKVAEQMVHQEVLSFEQWLSTQSAVPLIKELRRHFSKVARHEAEKTARMLKLEGANEKAINKLADAIVSKLLHAPTTELKREAASSADRALLVDAARRLFQLQPGEPNDERDEK